MTQALPTEVEITLRAQSQAREAAFGAALARRSRRARAETPGGRCVLRRGARNQTALQRFEKTREATGICTRWRGAETPHLEQAGHYGGVADAILSLDMMIGRRTDPSSFGR
jgi:hypothetical protein